MFRHDALTRPSSAVVSDIPRWLLDAAKTMCIRDREEALGRCLALSLEMLKLAAAHHVEAELIGWRVTDDADFLDHWAVAISATEVIDLTRVQIDGRTLPIYRIADYPPNFTQARRYPASALVDALALLDGNEADKFGAGFAWKLRCLLCRHELHRAFAARRPTDAGRALWTLAMFGLIDRINRVQCALRERRATLRQRLG